MRGMLSLLAGLGGGYNEGAQRQLDNDRRGRMDQIALDRSAREQMEFNQAQQDRTDLRAAGAPVAATPDTVVDATGNTVQREVAPPTMDNRDVGQPGEAPTAPAMRVGQQGGLNPMQAQIAAAAQNTPEAIRARQLPVLQRIDPEKASLLEARALTMKNAQLENANKEFDAGLNAAASKGFDALVDWTNKSSVSQSQNKAVPSSDGKTVEIHTLQPDGTLKPTGLVYENNSKGAMEAATMLSRMVPPQAKLKHYMDEQEASRKESHDAATETYQDRMATVAEKNADTNEKYRQDMGAAAGKRADAKGASAVDRMPEDVKLEYQTLNKEREKIEEAITKSQAEGMFDPKAPGTVLLNTRLNANKLRAATLLKQYRGDDAPAAPDPQGLRPSAAPSAAPAPAPKGRPATDGAGNPVVVPPGTQAARDAEAGRLIIRNELGGDPSRAQAEIARIDASLKADKSAPADARNMLMQKRAILVAGAASMPAQSAAAPAPVVTPPVAPPPPQGPMGRQVAAAAPTQADIPPPPVPFLNGNRGTPNPAFIQWTNTYHMTPDEWQAQQDQKDAARAAAARAAIDAARSGAPMARGNV